MKKYGFGILGCGVISKWHAEAIKSINSAVLVGVYDNNIDNAKKLSAEFDCKVFNSLEDMLNNPEIDVINICLPSGLHAEMAVKIANAKKHFVVEKPMAITKKQIEDIITACEKNNVIGTVISQLRFSENIRKVKQAIDNGELGKILLGDIYMKYYRSPEYYNSAGWRGTWEMDGGGALMNQGIHGIDALQYLVGPVKSVYGTCKTLARDIDVEDTAILVVEYENGAIGTIQGTTSVNPGYPRKIEISGTKGTIVLTEDNITRWDIEGSENEIIINNELNSSSFNNPTGGFTSERHRMQIKDLIDALNGGRKPLVDIYEGKKPVEIILAGYESSKTGKPVNIN